MHAPLSVHAFAHWREASGPVPVRRMSSTPVMTSTGFASVIPAGATLGHASTHLPQRVQASTISSMRAPSAVSKPTSPIEGCLSSRQAPSISSRGMNCHCGLLCDEILALDQRRVCNTPEWGSAALAASARRLLDGGGGREGDGDHEQACDNACNARLLLGARNGAATPTWDAARRHGCLATAGAGAGAGTASPTR